MSELKARHIVDVYDSYYAENPFGERSQVYLKSEADKVIAYRDCEIKKLKDSLNKLLKAKTEQILQEVIQKALIYGEGFVPVEHAIKLVAELRHNKYKRCLNMAKICENKLGTVVKPGWWDKWRRRWLELAEKIHEEEAK